MHELWLVSVDMNDRGLDGFGNVCAVESCTGLGGGCGETDLVVGDDVDDAV